MIKKLWPFVGEYRRQAILSPTVIMAEVVLELLIPLIMAKIIDVGIRGDGGMPYILRMGALMLLMAVLSLICGASAGKFAAEAGMGFAKNLRMKLFAKVQDFSFANIDKYSTASLVTRLTTDVNNVQNAFMMSLRMLFRAPLMLIGALVMAVSLSAKLSLVFLIACPVLAISLALIISKAYPRFNTMLTRYDEMNSSVQENLMGMRVVKSFVREEYETERFHSRADAVRKAQFMAEKLIILNAPIMQICMFTCMLSVLWFGGNMAIDGTMDIGQVSSFITYITQILISLMMISMIFIMLVVSRASIDRIVEVLDEKSTITDDGADISLVPEDGSVEFRNVSFSYSGDGSNPTLSDIDISIRPGEIIGIIGGTGSGKTSFVSLIPRLYDVTSGEVFVGGHDVREYTLKALRDSVAMVLQKNVLFSGTIRENLLWGNENATQEEIEAACRAAAAHDFIMAMPDGYDTVLGQGGAGVSGGQKQRLCIARALLKNPKIIILDDSTSAVDTATDASIRSALRENLSGTTAIIIAQRVSSVADADRIIVLDDGRIDGCGTHEQLLKDNAIYREVFESQQKGVA